MCANSVAAVLRTWQRVVPNIIAELSPRRNPRSMIEQNAPEISPFFSFLINSRSVMLTRQDNSGNFSLGKKIAHIPTHPLSGQDTANPGKSRRPA